LDFNVHNVVHPASRKTRTSRPNQQAEGGGRHDMPATLLPVWAPKRLVQPSTLQRYNVAVVSHA